MKIAKKTIVQAVALGAVLVAGVLIQASSGGSSTPPETPVDVYQRSWEHKVHVIQRKLDMNSPLKQTTLLHTHNSYNSKAYQTAVRYIDPNQDYSLKDQLRMDIRAIELDVHWYFSMHGWPWEWGKKALLCHGQGNHLGCSSYDRFLHEGIDEVNSWIRSNRGEVVLIYIERHLDGNEDNALSIINARLGDLIYRPTSSCQALPVNVTKQQVLNAGKNILLMTDGCAGGNKSWNNWVFVKDSSVKQGGGFSNYPGCGRSRSDYDNYLIRYWEDLTTLTDWFGGGEDNPVTEAVMAQMMKCGVNLPGVDKLKPTDGRLRGAVWSFNSGEPNNYGGNEDCVHQWGNGRWNDNNCSRNYRFACKNASGAWYVSNAAGPWTSGDSVCRNETGGAYKFSTPANGYENEKLHEAKRAKGQNDVWLRINDRASEGNWSL